MSGAGNDLREKVDVLVQEHGWTAVWAVLADHLAAAEGVNYDGPDPSVKCAYRPCTNRLRRADPFHGESQWCSPEHRRLTVGGISNG